MSTRIHAVFPLCFLIFACLSFNWAFAAATGSPFDRDIANEMGQLGREQAKEKAALANIKALMAQRKQWAQQVGGMPPGILKQQTLEGELSIAAVDYIDNEGNLGKSGRAYFIETDTGSQRFYPLNNPPEDTAHGKRIRVSGLSIDEQLVAEAIELLAAADGEVTALAALAEPPCEATGAQNGLVIAVNYLDDPTASPTLTKIHDTHFGETGSLRDYWREASYGKTDLTGDSFGWYTLDINRADACATNNVRTKALALAAAETDLTQYDRLFIVMRNPSPGCGWAGLGTLSCGNINTPDGTMHASTYWVLSSYYNNTNSGVWLSAHEAGHNINLHHSAVRDYGANSIGPIGGSATGSLVEYGDRYDSMGNHGSRPSHYNADHKYWVQWLTDSDILFNNGDANFTLEAMASPLSITPKAARLFRGVDTANFNKEYLWLEMRQPIGYDAFMDSRGFDGILVHHQTGTSRNKTENIDLHPGTDTGVADYFDTPLYASESFTDPYSGITISHLGLDINGNAIVDVSVDPTLLDSDEDGIKDTDESIYGTSPNLEDSDADGLTDLEEICFDGDCVIYNPYPGGGDTIADNADTEGDGMPDGWEVDNGLDPLLNDAANDNEPDGLTNLQEYLNGTDPNKADTDNDGLSDDEEVNLYGTDPANPDTDSDLMTDGWEVNNNLDPFNDDSALDPDGDSLSNLEEFNAGTNPRNSDTDGDDLNDFDELNVHGTNPLAFDTDSDGLSDGEEINQYGSDPFSSADTDQDRMSDDWENVRGTDVAVDDALVDADGDGVDNIVEFLRYSLPLDATSIPALATIYVDLNNTSGNEDGTLANPFSTLQAGLAAAQAGDTLQLAAGTYGLGFFSYNKAVRIVGADKLNTYLSATYFLPSALSWSKLENITVSASYSNYLFNARNVVYENCRVISTNGSLLVSNAKAIFRNCTLYGGVGSGINLDTDGDLIMENSTLSGYGTGVLVTDEGSSDISIRNAILSNTVDLSGVTDAGSLSYSLISDGQFASVNGNISGDPLFVDAIGGDYHLGIGSPAIDAGDPADDFGNEPAPGGCRINQGAFGNTVEATASPDPDNDGSHGYCEVIAGTDPAHPDTDHDGILDGADSAPLDLFTPAGEGQNLASDADFINATSSYSSSDTLHILSWSNVVGPNANNAIYTVEGGGSVLTGDLTDQGDGSYSATVTLGALGYTGTDVQVSTRLQRKKTRYEPSAVISITDNTVGNPPTVSITAPADGSTHTSGALIGFAGTADDIEDGDLSAAINWNSSLDGAIGNGAGFSATLTDGTHVITASISDTDANSSQIDITLTVGNPPAIVLSSATRTKGKNIFVDLSWSAATTANVDVYLNGALLVTTANNGAYSDNVGKNPSGTYDYQICEQGTGNCSNIESVVF